MDYISVYQTGNDKIAELIKNNADEIKSEVMADYIHLGEMKGFTKEWNHQRRDCYVRCGKTVKTVKQPVKTGKIWFYIRI